ncbi:MAG: S8 family serine peptidase [Caldilineaceae bacterium]|nr:S8 family serine peptidase [Caldilineaceae bacterium]
MKLTRTIFLTLFFAGVLLALDSVGRLAYAQEPTRPDLATLLAELEEQGSISLIVGLNVPSYDPAAFDSVQAAATLETAIADAQRGVLERLAGFAPANVKTYAYVPYVALTVNSPAALESLYADPGVTTIEKDMVLTPLVSETTTLVRAHFAHILFYRGGGQAVAVLDTGVDNDHPALAGKVVSEACYSTNNAGLGYSSLCPGGATSSVGTNAGDNCPLNVSGCDHGTHVGGIVTGLAPDANLIAIQVFTRVTDGGGNTSCANVNRTSPCTLNLTSDLISGLNRVFALRNSFNIASVNLSLGGGSYNSFCDSVSPSTKTAIDNLRNAGIAVVVAAGNSGNRTTIAFPACLSNVISVAATTKSDQVASYSNLSSFTTLFAPGSDIYAPIPVDSYEPKNGTSMAAPHVAAAVAMLKQARPDATVAQMASVLAGTGPLISDQRSGGTISKRRLDVYSALCSLITCDGDDYRTLLINQSLGGTFSPGTDRDHYFFNGASGNQLTLTLNRVSGTADPYLELYDPNGNRVALNNNGGTGSNALINGYTLQQTGRYLILARSANNGTGGYEVAASSQAIQLNPVPSISSLSPSSATGTLIASDFWVQIRGQNFLPSSQTYWNGQLRSSFYSSSTRIWIRVRGSDLGLPWPRTSFITVRNPEPGGGYSAPFPFSITFPFLGTSELVTPAPESIIPTGVATSFVISWTHPTDSWRTMQYMDLRLRDQNNNVAAWIRVREQPGTGSVYRLLNGSETALTDDGGQPEEGLPGEPRNLVITDTVTLHLADSQFFGSGSTAVMTPVVTFGPNAVGTYNIEFRVDGPDGEVQDDDVLGQITIVPAECPVSINNVTLAGPDTATTNTDLLYTATIDPLNATQPYTYTWSPEPKSGQGTDTATYNWGTAGEQYVFVGVENCGSFAGAVQAVRTYTTNGPDLAIEKEAPAVVRAGELLTYTITVTNSGAITATNLQVSDVLPPGATYMGGGTLNGSNVNWSQSDLPGYGSTARFEFAVTANQTLTNTSYAVAADSGANAFGSVPVVTRLVADHATASALVSSTLMAVSGSGLAVRVDAPAGTVADEATLVMETMSPPYGLPQGKGTVGGAFQLGAYRNGAAVNGFTMNEVVAMALQYPDSALGDLDEASLALYYWDGSQWTSAGIACTVDGAANQVACTADNPPAAVYALLADETGGKLYLPIVVQ